jgi:hypothetical protein
MNDTIVLARDTFSTAIDSVPDLLHSTHARARAVVSVPPPSLRRGEHPPSYPHRLHSGKGVSVIAKKKKAAKKKGKKKAKR